MDIIDIITCCLGSTPAETLKNIKNSGKLLTGYLEIIEDFLKENQESLYYCSLKEYPGADKAKIIHTLTENFIRNQKKNRLTLYVYLIVICELSGIVSEKGRKKRPPELSLKEDFDRVLHEFFPLSEEEKQSCTSLTGELCTRCDNSSMQEKVQICPVCLPGKEQLLPLLKEHHIMRKKQIITFIEDEIMPQKYTWRHKKRVKTLLKGLNNKRSLSDESAAALFLKMFRYVSIPEGPCSQRIFTILCTHLQSGSPMETLQLLLRLAETCITTAENHPQFSNFNIKKITCLLSHTLFSLFTSALTDSVTRRD